MATPKHTALTASAWWALRRPGTNVDCLLGCLTNVRSGEEWGWDIRERSLPQVRQCRTNGGFLWPETQIR